MKKKILLSLMIAVLGVLAFGAISVSAATYGDLTYTVSNGEVTITNCNESATGVEIPETINGYPVTAIGDRAFIYCYGLTSVTIPNSVTTIGENAFSYCYGLTSVTIPDSVTTIGYDAFYDCTALTRVNITSIEAWCKIDFASLHVNPLYYANNLYLNGNLVTNLIIPNSVTAIGDCAFYGYDGLTSVTIPDSVTTIGYGAFEYCTGLTSVTIPDSVTTIGEDAFSYCNGLKSVTISNSVKIIVSGAFRKCTGLTSISIPNSVKTIGYGAFEYCTGLTSVTIPDSVTTISDHAFYSCDDLRSVTIPNSVTTIGSEAFKYCTGLTRVNITSIEAWCKIDFDALYANPLIYANNLYLNGNLVTDLTIPDSVTTIGYGAFEYCTGLTSVIIPDSVTTIGSEAFRGCTGLTSVTIGSGVELIPESAFYSCNKLKYVCLPAELLYIRNDAFNYCPDIETVFYAGDESQWGQILFYNRNENLTDATIVYNAMKKTYQFETNCDVVLPEIYDYGVYTYPDVANAGKTLVGWYDNEDLNGTAVSFPYYGSATTLYAKWTDKTGTSFEDAFIAGANQEYTVTTTTSGQLVYFKFVPNITGGYTFFSSGSIDTYGYLYNSNKSQLTSDDDDGEDRNFSISYNLTAGKTYYIATKCYSGTGSFTLHIEKVADYTINSIKVKDCSGNELSQIPNGDFMATISITNNVQESNTMVVLAQYTSSGVFKGLMYVTVEDMPVGSTIGLTLPIDNTDGDIAMLKVFLRESMTSLTPMGNTVCFPAE